jgi:hypothetical protein
VGCFTVVISRHFSLESLSKIVDGGAEIPEEAPEFKYAPVTSVILRGLSQLTDWL